MTLSPEQREKSPIEKLLDSFESNELIRPHYQEMRKELIRDQCFSISIHILLTTERIAEKLAEAESSEQAWREAYEELNRKHMKTECLVVTQNRQLNQSVEVLKDCKYQIEQSNHPAGLGMLVSINNFLSSLSQGTEESV